MHPVTLSCIIGSPDTFLDESAASSRSHPTHRRDVPATPSPKGHHPMTIVFDVNGIDELTGGRLATLDLQDTCIVFRVPRQPATANDQRRPIPVTVGAHTFMEDAEP